MASCVFVVDDEEVIASSVAAILNLHGYSATFFTSTQKALAAAQSRAPDLLISDVVMPDISGIDLAIQVKAQHPTCKVLLFSGHVNTPELLEKARRQGHDFELLQKPVHPSVILMSIEALRANGEGGAEVPCEAKARLLDEYQAATLAFSEAVKELHQKIGTSPKEEYKRLERISTAARMKSEQRRVALEEHIASHCC